MDQLNEILVAVVALVALKVVVVVDLVVAVAVAAAVAAANVDVVLIALKNVCKSQKCQLRRLQRCRPNQLSSLSRSLSLALSLGFLVR